MSDVKPTVRAKAFTLIELLIVVAIIAILAAIAVPNMLEAQTRSKVARAHADMRTLAMAIETYRSDQSAYPWATTFCASRMSSIDAYNQTPEELTAPIAYVSTLPLDVFNNNQRYKYIKPGLGWANGDPSILALWVPKAFPIDGGETDDVPYFSPDESPVGWALWSVGPSGPLSVFDSDERHIPVPPRTWYDPTNGTASEGVIVRLSTGQIAPER